MNTNDLIDIILETKSTKVDIKIKNDVLCTFHIADVTADTVWTSDKPIRSSDAIVSKLLYLRAYGELEEDITKFRVLK